MENQKHPYQKPRIQKTTVDPTDTRRSLPIIRKLERRLDLSFIPAENVPECCYSCQYGVMTINYIVCRCEENIQEGMGLFDLNIVSEFMKCKRYKGWEKEKRRSGGGNQK